MRNRHNGGLIYHFARRYYVLNAVFCLNPVLSNLLNVISNDNTSIYCHLS